MPRKKFTPTLLDALRPSDGEVSDAHCIGLRAKCGKLGRVSFLTRFRRPGSRKGAKVVLGHFDPHSGEDADPVLSGPLTLHQARVLCANLRRDLARGIDPTIKKREARTQERLKLADTFEAVAREYVIRHGKAQGHRRWRNVAGALGLMVDRKTDELRAQVRKGSLVERFKSMPLSTLTRRDVQRITDALIDAGKPHAALSRFKVMKRLCRWAVDRAIIERSPLEGMRAPFKGTSRDRVLTDAEVRYLWRACGALGVFGAMVRSLLLTGCRRDEVRGLRHAEVEGDVWTVPAARMKGKREHVIFLSKVAQGIIDDVPRLLVGDKPSPLVFTSNGRKVIGGMARHKRELDAIMRKLMSADGVEFQSWRLHDTRRTMATNFQKLGIRFEVTEACLAHIGQSRGGVAGIYSRHDWAPEKRAAWDAWAERLTAIVEKRPGASNVIKLPERTSA